MYGAFRGNRPDDESTRIGFMKCLDSLVRAKHIVVFPDAPEPTPRNSGPYDESDWVRLTKEGYDSVVGE